MMSLLRMTTTLIMMLAVAQTALAATEIKQNFETETIGAEPKSLAVMVGNWVIAKPSNGNTVLSVDGRKWSSGQTSTGLADKTRALYGERYAEFLDNVQTYAYFPIAVMKEVSNFHDGEISMRFLCVDGRIDQAAGILFNVQPNGNYMTLRANCLEDNLVLFKYEKGNRTSVKWVRNTPTPTGKWHDLKLLVKGKMVEGSLDGKPYLNFSLTVPVSGRVGIWSKADSVVHFDDYRVNPSDI